MQVSKNLLDYVKKGLIAIKFMVLCIYIYISRLARGKGGSMSEQQEDTIVEFTREQSLKLLERAAKQCGLAAARGLDLDGSTECAYYLDSEPDCVTVNAVYEVGEEYQHLSFYTESFTHETGPTWEALILHRSPRPLGQTFSSPAEGMAWFDREVMGFTK
jgi:hypothetical protein